MIKELSNKFIYDDFKNKVILTDEEVKVLDMYIRKESIIKIADTCSMSDRNISRIIRELKQKYKNYKCIELAKCDIFSS